MTHSYEYRTLLSGSLSWSTHSPEHFIESRTLLRTLFSDLLLRAIFWALVWALQLVWGLLWALSRVHLLSRALFWVDLLSRVLFWALFGGLSVHQNLPLLTTKILSSGQNMLVSLSSNNHSYCLRCIGFLHRTYHDLISTLSKNATLWPGTLHMQSLQKKRHKFGLPSVSWLSECWNN